MKQQIKFVLLAVILTFGQAVMSQGPLKIIAYNLEGMKPGTSPGLRLGFIIEKLKTLDPDIVALQEVNEDLNGNNDDNQGMVIAAALSEYFGAEYFYYQQQTHLSWDNQFKEFIGIVSKYPVEESGYHQLMQGVFPRKVIWNHIETPLGKINFFCTHLSFNSQSVRIQQVQQITDYINTIENDYSAEATILCGDFNDPPTSPTITHLTGAGGDGFYYSTFAETNPDLPGYTVPSNSPSSKIDYVFLHDQSQIHVDSSLLVMEGPITGGIYCSDHLGVESFFDIGPQSIESYSGTTIKKNFIIGQVRPNPARGKMEVGFEMLGPYPLKISLLDISGHELLEIFNGKKAPGPHQIQFSLPKRGNSICFLKFESGPYVEIKKIISIQ